MSSSSTLLVPRRLVRRFLCCAALLCPLLCTTSGFAQAVSADPAESEIPEFGDPEAKAYRITGQVLSTDGKPVPGAVLRMVGHVASGLVAELKSDASGRFEFLVHTPMEALWSLRFTARTSDGTQLAFHRFESTAENQWDLEDLEVRLEPVRQAQVEVRDKEGQPIEGARVALGLRFPFSSDAAETNEAGMASISIPTSERILAVVAWKDHAGLDYKLYQLNRYEQADVKAAPPEFPVDRAESLVLSGAQPLTVTVVESADGSPVPDVTVYPWLLDKDPIAGNDLNLSLFSELFCERTSKSGVAEINWMPAWQTTLVTVWPYLEGFERPRANYDPATGGGSLRIELNRLVPIRGRVLDDAGQAVAGATIEALGEGYAFNEFRDSTETNASGEYELRVAPNMCCLLTASHEQRVAAAHTGFVVYPNQPVKDRNFQLRKATRVFGTLLNERTQQAIPEARVLVYQYGTDLDAIAGPKVPNPEGERWVVQPVKQYYATTNAKGEFEFFLGDGKFDLRPPKQEKVEKFEIAGEEELEFELTTKVYEEVELVGLVISKENRQPVSKARVHGVPREFGSMDWTATTDEDGKFQVRRQQEPTYVQVTNQDKTLASIVEVQDLSRTFIVQLEPVGRAIGRVVDDQGKPVIGQKINYGVDVPAVDNQTWSNRFGGSVVTDEQGEFQLESLAAGWEYDLSLPPTPEGRIPQVASVQVEPEQMVDLGDITLR